jgi:hypothetical protein
VKAKFADFLYYALRCILWAATGLGTARRSMARANDYVDRYTNLRCVENDHPFADNITWIGLYVYEQNELDWRPDVEGMICPYPDCGS